METIIVLCIVGIAFAYVARTLYRQFSGKGGCSSGCSCSPEVKHSCNGAQQLLDKDL